MIHMHWVCLSKPDCDSLTPRYETLAVATEAESRQDADLPLKTGGKRLTVSPEHSSVQRRFHDKILLLVINVTLNDKVVKSGGFGGEVGGRWLLRSDKL